MFGISRKSCTVKSIWKSLQKIYILLLEAPMTVKLTRNGRKEIHNPRNEEDESYHIFYNNNLFSNFKRTIVVNHSSWFK